MIHWTNEPCFKFYAETKSKNTTIANNLVVVRMISLAESSSNTSLLTNGDTKKSSNLSEFHKNSGWHNVQKATIYLKEKFNEIFVDNLVEVDTHNKNEKRTNSSVTDSIIIERQGGIRNRFVLILLALWYLFSAFTLYTNKFIVDSQKVNPKLVGATQMIVTSLLGFLQIKHVKIKKSKFQLMPQNNGSNQILTFFFWRNMIIIGSLRY